MPDTALYVLRAATGFKLGAELAELVLAYAPVSADDERDFCAATSGEWHKLHSPIEYASRTDDLLMLQWWLRDTPSNEGFTACVARGGSLGLLRWAYGAGHSLRHAAAGAAYGGQTAVLHWLLAVEAPGFESREQLGGLLIVAAEEGHFGAVRWLYAIGAELSLEACQAAARRGDLRMLRWLRERECPWDASVVEEAAQGGNMNLLRWAIGAGCDWISREGSVTALMNRAESPECFESAPLDPYFEQDYCVCKVAAMFGRTDFLMWALPKANLSGRLPPYGGNAPRSYLCINLARNGYLREFQEVHSEARRGPHYCGERCCGKPLLCMVVRRAAILQRAVRLGLRLSRPGVRGMSCQGKVFCRARKERAAPAEALKWIASHPYPKQAEEWDELHGLVEAYSGDLNVPKGSADSCCA